MDPRMIAKRLLLQLGKLTSHIMVMQQIEDTNYYQNSQVVFDYQNKHKHIQYEDKNFNQHKDFTMQLQPQMTG
ncbi:MAG: hypothetical protein EZS28_032361 [Streblomastix strix]|uniref:Uncharacterized protein n=1 Tax=Streblomastix strix TaxID=222440 RepID=A0A5J4UPW4_9EUKA|nr:MAG: hypothetical protein EZS28_032361 [Streblomastix strix]